MHTNKGLAPVVLVIILALVLGGGYAIVSQKLKVGSFKEEAKGEQTAEPSTQKTAQSQTVVPADWKTYRNEKYGFELRYPDEIAIDTTLDNPTGTCVFFKFLTHGKDRILINSIDTTEDFCGMTTGRGAFDKDITGKITVGNNVYNATGYSADNYEELDARLPDGVYVRYWIDKGVWFARHKEVVKKVLSSFRFTK